jgi:hypothetical protein
VGYVPSPEPSVGADINICPYQNSNVGMNLDERPRCVPIIYRVICSNIKNKFGITEVLAISQK